MTYKSRVLWSGNYESRPTFANSWVKGTQTFMDTSEILISQEHPSWRRKSDGGGPFLMVQTKNEVAPGFLNNTLHRGPYVGTAFLGEGGQSGAFAIPTIMSDSAMFAKGTTAIARSLPTNPAAQLSTALGELGKDGLPSIIGSTAFKQQVSTAKKAGNEYLNYEFGWLPLVSDLKKFAHAVKHRDEIMHGYLKYSDKQIRRSYDFPSTEGTASYSGNGSIDLNTSMYTRADLVYSYKSREWFSGAFRYHVPTPVGFAGKVAYYKAEASKILGLELTPEVVWNLAPWSWAADWFANTGDVIHNISRLGKDGLVMRYGYQMRYAEASREILYFPRSDYPLTAGFNSRWKKTNSISQRVRATPYGFGLTFNGLNNTQKAVVAALGLSRAF